MEWGAEVKALLKVWKESGNKPTALQRRPQLKTQDKYYIDCFWELSSSRGAGESFGPIPISEYEAYWRAFGVTGIEERYRFWKVLSKLDHLYVSHVQKKRQQQVEQAQAQGRAPQAKGGLLRK